MSVFRGTRTAILLQKMSGISRTRHFSGVIRLAEAVTSEKRHKFGLPSPANVPSWYPVLVTRRNLASVKDGASPSNMHAQVCRTLSTSPPQPPLQSTTTTPPATAAAPKPLDPNAPRGVVQQIFRHPDRRARYNQALWNTGAAFMLMLMAAQSLKANRERRRVNKELVQVQAESDQRLALLQSLFQNETIEKLVDDIDRATLGDTSPQKSSWFGAMAKSTIGNNNNKGKEELKLKLANVLLRSFDDLLGAHVLDEAQREALRVRIQQSTATEPASSSFVTAGAAAAVVKNKEAVVSGDVVALPPTPQAVANKRVPFTM